MSGHSNYQPTTAVGKWFHERLPIVAFGMEQLAFPTPKNLNYWYTFGGILAVMLMVQIITGIVLVMHYTPNAALAFDSIEHIMRNVNYGWLIRYLHMNGASMFFIAVYIHMFRGMYYGSYKAPREVLWMIGVIIYLIMMAAAFMGYVLPWGNMSGWGVTVITNLFSAIPFVGDYIHTLLLGAYSVDNPALQHFFSLHYLLPFVLAGFVVLHIWALHVPGNNNPTGISVKGPQDTIPFHPYYTIKDGFAIVVFFVVYALFVFYGPNYMGDPMNYSQFDKLAPPAEIKPEWYYLPFYAILRSIPWKLPGVLAMFGSILILLLLPWLDSSRVRSGKYRPVFKLEFWVFVAVCIALGYIGSRKPEGGYVIAGQLLTIYYFLHFIVFLPLMGLLETPKALPNSISDDVLARAKAAE